MTKVIGLTGGIASGKSTVSKLLIANNIPVIDADKVVYELEAKGKPGLNALIKVFGQQILTPDGELNRKKLGQLVFNDSDKMSKLNQVMQPLIWDEIWQRVTKLRHNGVPYVVLDVPLLFEAGYAKKCDLVIVVNVDLEKQLQRLQKRNSYSKVEARHRIEAQMPLDDKCRQADLVIDNNGSLAELTDQVGDLIKQLNSKKL